MRLLPLVSAIALLSTASLSPLARADEVKYKSQHQREREDGVYKRQPDNPPAERPPDREHPFKQRPDDHPSEPDQPPPPPPPWGGPLSPPPCLPSYCPPPAWDDDAVTESVDIIDPIIEPIGMELNGILSDRMARMQAEGFVGQIAVGYGSQIQFQRNYEWRRYDIGAVAESFTAWAVYQLIDARRLSLNTTVGVLFPQSPADKREITIEQLLSHTSGLGNTRLADGETDRNRAVAQLLGQPLEHAPGASFTYSADGYVILAAAIEIISARDYDMFLWESGVISPDMTGTMFARNTGSALRQKEWGIRGVGGILSTAPDLFAWTSRFMQSAAMERITQPRWWVDDGVAVGHGWYSTEYNSEPPLLQASGWVDTGDNVMVVVYPNGAILVVMSDRTYGGVPWSEQVANELEPVLRGLQPNGEVRTVGLSEAVGGGR
jgi:CubicO group peptidase (beta-lactamase class C family)